MTTVSPATDDPGRVSAIEKICWAIAITIVTISIVVGGQLATRVLSHPLNRTLAPTSWPAAVSSPRRSSDPIHPGIGVVGRGA